MIGDGGTETASTEPAIDMATSEAPAADPDLDALIAEYIAQTGRPEQAQPAVQNQPAPERDSGAELRNSMHSNRELLELRLWAQDVEGERLERREHEAREFAFAQAEKHLEGLEHLPAEFARRWLIAEANLDPELHHAWHNRYESEDAMRVCRNTLRRSLTKMREEASRMPDPDASGDRALVIDAIKRGGLSGPIEKREPDLSRMSDQEFQAYKEKIGL